MTHDHLPIMNDDQGLFSARVSRRTAMHGAAAAGVAMHIGTGVRHAAAQAAASDVELHLPFNPYGEAVVLHPHQAPNWGPFWVTLPYVWSGLVRFDEHGAVEMDLAESVTPNADGTVWTAKLKSNLAFANGDALTAEHVVNAWKAALTPRTSTSMSTYMMDIKGAKAFASSGTGELGVRIADASTIEIILEKPKANFLSRLATFVFAVVHPTLLQQPTADPKGLAGMSAGAWQISDVSETAITMTPNEHYWAEPSASVSSVVWDIAPTGGTDQSILDAYLNGDAAIADVPAAEFERLAADATVKDQIVIVEQPGNTLSLAMDFHQSPFDRLDVRRAIAHAVDRETWAKDVTKGAFVAAHSFTPPVLKKIANYAAPQAPTFDAAKATDLLSPAGTTDMPEILLFQPATDAPAQIDIVAALVNQIAQATGLTISHNTTLTREQINSYRQDTGGLQMHLVEWWNDSNTPSLLEVASSTSASNTGWINWEPKLDAKVSGSAGEDAKAFTDGVDKASATMDEAARNDLYLAAETTLLDDAVYVPIGHRAQCFLQKPWLKGTKQGAWTGSTPVRIDKDVTVTSEYQPKS